MKKLLILICFLVFIGGICFIVIGSMKIAKSDKYKIDKTYDITEEVNDINIEVETTDMEIIYLGGDDHNQRVECVESEKISHEVYVKDGTLYIKTKDERKFYDRFFSFVDMKMKIYLDKNVLGNAKIEISTGDVVINKEFKFDSLNIHGSTGDMYLYMNEAKDVDISLSTGDIKMENSTLTSLKIDSSTGKTLLKNVVVTGDVDLVSSTGYKSLENVKCNKLNINSSTGELSMKKVECSGVMTIKQSTGDVDFDDIDAEKIHMELSSGDVVGYFYTDWTIFAKSKSGRIDVPELTGKICEVTTKSGKIVIKIK